LAQLLKYLECGRYPTRVHPQVNRLAAAVRIWAQIL